MNFIQCETVCRVFSAMLNYLNRQFNELRPVLRMWPATNISVTNHTANSAIAAKIGKQTSRPSLKSELQRPQDLCRTTPSGTIMASVYIICQDEEDNIARVLTSVSDFDEVILVDSGSTDKTLDIAATFPNVKISHQTWLGYARQKEHAKSLCRHSWVLSLDSDQTLSPDLKAYIIDMLENDKGYVALEGPIVSNDYLMKKSHRLSRYNTAIKFFKKNAGSYPDVSVHESVKVNGRVKRISAAIHHHGNEKIDEAISKINRYSTLRVNDKVKKGRKPSLMKLIFIFQYAFFKSYIVKRNFLNGTGGFIGSTCQAFYAFLKEAKLFYAHYQQNPSGNPDARP